MNRPRRPFGSTRPGQLLATRIKVLAAELSDPDRLRRGRTYASNGSVIDITIGDGAATGTVLGSRSDPYLVELTAEPGEGTPARSEVAARCTCPDDDLHARTWCKHAVATLLVLADEVALEPEVLDRWRGADADDDVDLAASDAGPVTSTPGVGHAPVPTRTAASRKVVRRRDPLDGQLTIPRDVAMPVIPEIPASPRVPVNDDDLDRWITEALAILAGPTGE